ncbi:MAG: SNF2-related protein [Cyanobacteria bacterium P01_H01_bin.74]
MPNISTLIHFNFGYIKQQAKPGSWRRGYNYFKENQLTFIDLDMIGVRATVKGKFKEAYTIQLKFKGDRVEPVCDCPLEDKWCKHAIAVALEAVKQNHWEIYYDLPLTEDNLEQVPIEYCQGAYRFMIKPDKHHKPKHVGVRVEYRKHHKIVHNIESTLKKTLEAIQQKEDASVSDAEKNEIRLLQFLVIQTKNKPDNGWFSVPLSEADQLFKLLAQVEEVCNANNKRLYFTIEPLFLMVSVNISNTGSVMLALHWINQSPFDAYPLDEVTLFGKNVPWGIRETTVYPLSNKLSDLPNYMTRNTFTDIKDSDGGKFIYEELPKLQKIVDMDLADIVNQLKLTKLKPTPHISAELLDEATLKMRVTVDFYYGDTKVPFNKKAPDTPYVSVSKKEGKKQKDAEVYWIKRDIAEEAKIYQSLLDAGLEVLQTNHLFAEGDHAIDFYNYFLPEKTNQTVNPWQAKYAKNLVILKSSSHPLHLRGKLEFSNTVDQFILSIDCTIGELTIALDEVQRHLMQGKKYFFKKDVGYIEVPLAEILHFIKTLEFFDAETLEKDLYQIQTYRAGLIAELLDQGIQMEMSEKFQKFWEVISSQQAMDDIAIPEAVTADLRPYQKAGFNWLCFLYIYGLNGILADDMGLGKTLQTLVLLQYAKETDGQMPSLIVCPTSVVYNWINEINKFTPNLTVVNLTGSDRYNQYKKVKTADAIITSYSLLRRDIRSLKEYPFRYVILDESQNIKNFTSQTANASKTLQSSHRLALSGTPVENRLMELWSVFDFLMPGFLYMPEDFRFRYVTPIEERGNRDAERRLKKQVFPFMLRRLKQDVAKDLPPKIESVQYCQLTDSQRELYLDFLDKTREEVFANVAEKGIKGSTNSIFAALIRLRQICCHPRLLGEDLSGGLVESGKFDALKEMLTDVMAKGHRILLFSQFVEMLKIIRSWLEVKGVKHEFLTGESRDRHIMVDRFNNDPSIPIFLMSLKAGGTGLNLTGADYVIHYDPWWNPAAEDQASDRAHRIGQKRTVFVYRLITKGTVEEKILKLQDRKRDLVDSIIAADRSVGKQLSIEDLKDILSPDF